MVPDSKHSPSDYQYPLLLAITTKTLVYTWNWPNSKMALGQNRGVTCTSFFIFDHESTHIALLQTPRLSTYYD